MNQIDIIFCKNSRNIISNVVVLNDTDDDICTIQCSTTYPTQSVKAYLILDDNVHDPSAVQIDCELSQYSSSYYIQLPLLQNTKSICLRIDDILSDIDVVVNNIILNYRKFVDAQWQNYLFNLQRDMEQNNYILPKIVDVNVPLYLDLIPGHLNIFQDKNTKNMLQTSYGNVELDNQSIVTLQSSKYYALRSFELNNNYQDSSISIFWQEEKRNKSTKYSQCKLLYYYDPSTLKTFIYSSDVNLITVQEVQNMFCSIHYVKTLPFNSETNVLLGNKQNIFYQIYQGDDSFPLIEHSITNELHDHFKKQDSFLKFSNDRLREETLIILNFNFHTDIDYQQEVIITKVQQNNINILNPQDMQNIKHINDAYLQWCNQKFLSLEILPTNFQQSIYTKVNSIGKQLCQEDYPYQIEKKDIHFPNTSLSFFAADEEVQLILTFTIKKI